ncbi:MAG TPA: alpha/beta hydrolase [Candidatus Nitrosocosmicus sp.]|jgi:pimeloyl-ACP methyl ester carboxylesterase|nr:alpha/beta hydrolase [Candidatus Nitrosocosmicus sp.]
MSQPVLSEKYRLINYHRRGYMGSSHNVSDVSIKQQADDSKELLRTLNIDRAHVIGYSNAGLIALQFAHDAPEMVHTLSLLEPALIGHVPSGPQFANRLQNTIGLLQNGKKAEALDSFLQIVFEDSSQYRGIIDKQLSAGSFDAAVRNLETIFRIEAPALQSWNFTIDDAKSIHQPKLYIGGENSALYFQETRELLSTWFSQLETVMLPNTTHMLHMINPNLVAKNLSNFLGRNPIQ